MKPKRWRNPAVTPDGRSSAQLAASRRRAGAAQCLACKADGFAHSCRPPDTPRTQQLAAMDPAAPEPASANGAPHASPNGVSEASTEAANGAHDEPQASHAGPLCLQAAVQKRRRQRRQYPPPCACVRPLAASHFLPLPPAPSPHSWTLQLSAAGPVGWQPPRPSCWPGGRGCRVARALPLHRGAPSPPTRNSIPLSHQSSPAAPPPMHQPWPARGGVRARPAAPTRRRRHDPAQWHPGPGRHRSRSGRGGAGGRLTPGQEQARHAALPAALWGPQRCLCCAQGRQ